jgi:CRISPR-associated endonuclease Csn1
VYRLALDLGTTSLGWAIIRLHKDETPYAISKAGVRIFSNGRDPKDGSSLAVTRREARAMRRRRDRLLRRKARMADKLIAYGFFPKDMQARKELEQLNPYELRAKGLDQALTPAEFARALFHINQRRGFQSNRKTDKKDNDTGAMKVALSAMRQDLKATASRTVGEYLYKRLTDPVKAAKDRKVRARYRETPYVNEEGKNRIEKSYDLYIDRKMIADEFDELWKAQERFNPQLFNTTAGADLRDTLLYQRKLKPVKPGRCTLLPTEVRAPLALPSNQQFRIYQEVNHLRILGEGLKEKELSLEQRDKVASALEINGKRSFDQIRKLLGLSGSDQFNLEDAKRTELKGNATSAALTKKDLFGKTWFTFSLELQDNIVIQLINEENLDALADWLNKHTGVDHETALRIADAGLPEGYGSLSSEALSLILPKLQEKVITYDKAVKAAGFEHHSQLGFEALPSELMDWTHPETGEIKQFFKELPYYGKALQRHVAFGSGEENHSDEKRYGKIANPTVHIGLNQVRAVVNELIARYGHPHEVIVELARDLKQSREQRMEEQRQQAINQKRNERIRQEIAAVKQISENRVKKNDIQKWILWEQLSFDIADRRCPYSGIHISAAMLLGDEVEIEHILPFSQTLDDSMNNRTVAMRQANRIKGNRTPWQARADFETQGWSYDGILQRAERMPKQKRYRFAVDGYERWLGEDNGFLARALNDTRYLSRIARDYMSLICPNVRVIPGKMTAQLRGKFGLNDILGLDGEKNRDDHRHHAVDACVIGVTDQGLLQRFSEASADARGKGVIKLVETMPDPWPTYRMQVKRAVNAIWVSHKPDHSYEGEMFDQTIYSAHGKSKAAAKIRSVIPFNARENQPSVLARHVDSKGQPQAYKGLLSNSNYCIEISRNQSEWIGEVIPTYQAYENAKLFVSKEEAYKKLRDSRFSLSTKPLVMRLSINDTIRAEIDGALLVLQVLKINSSGSITFIKVNETNISARYTAKLAAQKLAKEGKPFDSIALNDDFFQKAITAGSLKEYKARRVTISPIGELRDPGFKE